MSAKLQKFLIQRENNSLQELHLIFFGLGNFLLVFSLIKGSAQIRFD